MYDFSVSRIVIARRRRGFYDGTNCERKQNSAEVGEIRTGLDGPTPSQEYLQKNGRRACELKDNFVLERKVTDHPIVSSEAFQSDKPTPNSRIYSQ